MYTALRATSLTLAEFLLQRFISDAGLAAFFDPGMGGTMRVTLATPEEMAGNDKEGLSVWLYRVARDEERLNAPPEDQPRVQDTHDLWEYSAQHGECSGGLELRNPWRDVAPGRQARVNGRRLGFAPQCA